MLIQDSRCKEMYNTLESLEGVVYSIGYQMNPRVKRESDEVLQQSVTAFESTGEPQRNFELLDYRAATWPCSRSVVVKCEVQAAGTKSSRGGHQSAPV